MRSKWVLVSVLLLCFGFLVGAGVNAAFGQPTVVGKWLFDISGVDQGGAVIEFFGNQTLQAYGLTLESEDFEFGGSYTINEKGVISGVLDLPGRSESFTGKVDKKITKMTLKTDGPTLKGIRFPAVDPGIPQNWVVKISRLKGAFDPFTIVPEGENTRLYTFSGSGTFQDIDTMTITVDGTFFLNSKNVAYGVYTASIIGGDTVEDAGVLSGKINLSSGKLSFKIISVEGDRLTLSGVAK